MALPPWTIELLRRGLNDVAQKAQNTEALDKIKSQATEILQDLPETAARGIASASKQIDRLVRSAEAGSDSIRRWTDKYTGTSVACINGTGILQCEGGPLPSVGEGVIAKGIEFMSGGRLVSEKAHLRQSQLLAQACGCDYETAVLATANFAGAVMSMSLLGIRTPLLMPRSDAIRIQGRPLPEILGGVLPVVEEIGDAHGWTFEDANRSDATYLVQADGGSAAIDLDRDVPEKCRKIAVLSAGWCGELPQPETQDGDDVLSLGLPNARELLKRGFDLVVLPGAGILGGPESGLMIGKVNIIEELSSQSIWPALAADPAKTAMLAHALASVTEPTIETHPVLLMCMTSVNNLRGRAERLATRLTASDDSYTTQITDRPAHLVANGRWQIPSRQVRLFKNGSDPKELAERFASRNPSLLLDHDEESVFIDLRWVNPEQDQLIQLPGSLFST